ncbi:MAG TPA: phosphoribosyltransferase family protein [Gemmatimonadaceae bacterium]|nr:phosphoribosyltransferase family protein [Gemmatimonadaceae bacterium]
MLFADRADAGRQLAETLLARMPALRQEQPLVLGIPRGGVIIGREVARALGAPLDVIVARKLGAPGHEELGIGAVAPDGTRVLDGEIVAALGVSDAYIEKITRLERAELDRRMRRFRGERPLPDLAGRAVVLADDGLATGVTARAALASVRRAHPAALVFAAPVCSEDGCRALTADGYTVVCVATPVEFRGVGEWYADFEQVSDDTVVAVLERAAAGSA